MPDFWLYPDPHVAAGSPWAPSTVPENGRSPRSSAGNPGPRGPRGEAALHSGLGRQGRPAASSHLHPVTGTHQSGLPHVPAQSDIERPAPPSPCHLAPFQVRCPIILPCLNVTGGSCCVTQSPVLGTGCSLPAPTSQDPDHSTLKHQWLGWRTQRKKTVRIPLMSPANIPLLPPRTCPPGKL